jgi:hypothetical protein
MAYCYQPLDKFYQGDDLFFHYRRLAALIESISNGTFPYYIDNDALLQYGYATKLFYPDIILLPFAIIGKYTNLYFSYRLLIIVMTFLCGLFSYKLAYKVTKNNFSSIISSLIYTFSLYRLLDLYTRSALGEALAFTFIPIIFLGLYEIIYGNYKRWYIITIGFTLLILTHLLSTVITALFVIIFLIIYCKKLFKEPIRFMYLILAGIVTIPLVAYYIFPMLEQMASNNFYYQEMPVANLPYNNKLSIKEVLSGMFGGFQINQYNFLPGVGVILIIIAASRILIRKRKEKLLKLADTLLIIGTICLILTADFIPWARFPFTLLNVIQFPWRLLEFTTFFFALSGGYYLSILIKNKKAKYITLGIIIVATIVMINIDSYNYNNSPKLSYAVGKLEIRNPLPIKDNNYHLGNLEYVPRKFPSYPQVNFPDKDILISRSNIVAKNKENTIISNYNTHKGITTIKITNTQPDTLEIPKFYYKGYTATFNNKETELFESNIGLINIPIKKSGEIKLWYKGTLIQKASYIISLISSLIFIIIVLILERKQRKNA